MRQHLVLIGLMGSGKSTVARHLRRRWNCPVYELDALLEKAQGLTIPEIFAQKGEAFFRAREREWVETLAELDFGIVSTGGGTFMDEANQQILLNQGQVFYLQGSAEVLAKRIQSTANRPLLHGQDKVKILKELWDKRNQAYLKAHHIIATDHRSSQEVAVEIGEIFDRTTVRMPTAEAASFSPSA